ncbi:putative reverse transcriptase domain-containing protein [Tanacetum coccineum]
MLREVRLHCPAISRWVEFCYSNPTRLYYGEHTLWPCQGVQQGDPLGPLLFSLVLHPLICKIRDSFSLSLHAWYLDDGTIVGDTVVVGKVLELIMKDEPGCGLHRNIDKTEVLLPKEDPRSRLAGIFPPNISRPLHGVKLLGGPASVDFDFCNELVMKRVAKTIGLMDAIAKINDPQCELLLLRSCTGISRLYFTMRTCPPRVFESAQRSFDMALRSSLERIVTASGLGFGDWQWRLSTLPFAFGGLGVYYAGDVLNYIFLASRLQSVGLQTKLLRHTCIVSPGPIFDDALSVFNTFMQTDVLSNPSKRVRHGLSDATIGYGFLPFSLSSLGELETDAVTLLKRIWKFSMSQDIGVRAAVHIFNRISFAIAKKVETLIVSRLPSNLL